MVSTKRTIGTLHTCYQHSMSFCLFLMTVSFYNVTCPSENSDFIHHIGPFISDSSDYFRKQLTVWPIYQHPFWYSGASFKCKTMSNYSTHNLRLVFLLISNLTNGLRLHQFLGTKTTETNKPLKTDANRAH